MIQIWKQHFNKGNLVGVLLTDLSKVFNTINLSLLMAKLEELTVSLQSPSSNFCRVIDFSKFR